MNAAHQDSTSTNEGRESSHIREDVVQRLLHGFEHDTGPASMADFIGLEFSHASPTDGERAEAHRRYVEELVHRGTRTARLSHQG